MATADSDEHIDRTHWIEWSKDDPLIKAERRRARNAVAVEGNRGGREYRSLTAPLDAYIARRNITAEQYRAGRRIHAIWRNSILRERYVRMNYGEPGSGFDMDSIALAPRDYLNAMEAVQGELQKRIVRWVCCEERFCGIRGGMAALQSGLDDLVRHFQIDGESTSQP